MKHTFYRKVKVYEEGYNSQFAESRDETILKLHRYLSILGYNSQFAESRDETVHRKKFFKTLS